MQPLIVFIADELTATACGRAATFAHEMKHVAIFRQTLADAARELRSEIAGKLGGGVRRASNRAELERQYKAAVQDYMGAFFRRWHGVLEERNAALDFAAGIHGSAAGLSLTADSSVSPRNEAPVLMPHPERQRGICCS
jgi:hypothetical protein